MLILLTTLRAAAKVNALMNATDQKAIPLSSFSEWHQPAIPANRLYPTVPAALRGAMNAGISDPAFLATNCIPAYLAPMPCPYEVNQNDTDKITVKGLPTIPGILGIDFAVAFAMCQLAVAVKLLKSDQNEHAAYFIEAAGLSAGCCSSVASAEVMEQMYSAFNDGPETVPWPEGILWPDGVAPWLQGFGVSADQEG